MKTGSIHQTLPARALRLMTGGFLLGLTICSVHASTEASTEARPESADDHRPTRRPNLLLIVADDLGYADLGAFGSEISTPTLDGLAAQGLVLTSYYSAPLCAPTRAELLSGTDHHLAGEGLMGVNVAGAPGYEGRLNERVVTVASRLRQAGYHTYMSGKWHLGSGPGQRPASRGFDRSFILTDGGASHFAEGVTGLRQQGNVYYDDDQVVDRLPADFYSTDYYTDRIIGYIREQQRDDRPFFAYLAYTAPHWPIQAPTAEIEQQRGRYDEGYEVLRQRRFAAWKRLGMAPADAELPELPDNYRPWHALSEQEQAESARIMETYAAMVTRLDREIGRLIRFLRDNGELNDTLIIFQSDNGAEANTGYPGIGLNADNSLESLGKPGSFAFIGPGWAEAGSAPFRQNKTYTTEGGIRVPAFVHAPWLGVPARRDDSLIMTYDLAPTLLDLAGAHYDPASEAEGRLPMTGRSFAALLRGEAFTQQRGPEDVVGREHAGHAAIRRGDWKLVWENAETFYRGRSPGEGEPPAMSGQPIDRTRLDAGGPQGVPIGSGGPWQLFNVEQDPAERHDLSDERPDLVEELLREWNDYVARHGVIVRSGRDD